MPKVVDVDTDRLNELRRQGYTYMEIAKMMGISASTVNRRLINPQGMTSNSGYTKRCYTKKEELNGPVVKYVPEYRMDITPQTSNVEYTYKGIKFVISGDKRVACITSSCIVDVVGTEYEPKQITLDNINSIINIGEALVGVANYIKNNLNK